MLQYKSDWDQTKKFLTAWWAGENENRCALAVYARKTGSEGIMPPALPDKVEDRWLDFDYLHKNNEYRMKATFYGGEAFPMWNAGYPGWGSIPMYMGLEIELK